MLLRHCCRFFGNNVAVFEDNVETGNIVVETGDIVAKNGNNVEATFDIVERIVKLVAFDNVAWTLLLGMD